MSEAKQVTGAFIIALLLISASPLGAQVVIGGDQPDVDVSVNWAVLDKLGPSPSLPDMLKQAPTAKAVDQRIQRKVNEAENKVIFHKLDGSPGHALTARKPILASNESDGEKPTYRVFKPTPGPARAVDPNGIKAVHLDEPSPAAKPKKAADVAVPAQPSVATPPPIAVPTPVPATVAAKQKADAPLVVVKETPKPAPEAPAVKSSVASLIAPPPVATPAAPVQPAPAAPTVQTPVAQTPPAPAPAPAPPQQVAALPNPTPTPSSNTTSDGIIRHDDMLTVLFRPDENQLPSGAMPALTQLAQRMSRDDSLTLKLLAYADGDSSSISKARRLSLSRALEVRKVLMDLGVRSTRIEVRALGSKRDGSAPIDRVDALVTSH